MKKLFFPCRDDLLPVGSPFQENPSSLYEVSREYNDDGRRKKKELRNVINGSHQNEIQVEK